MGEDSVPSVQLRTALGVEAPEKGEVVCEGEEHRVGRGVKPGLGEPRSVRPPGTPGCAPGVLEEEGEGDS